MDWSGRVAVVTGSTSGIGRAIAEQLSALGVQVVLNSRTSAEEGERLAEALPAALYRQADVADDEQARQLVEFAVDRCGRLDFLVNNAGTTVHIPHADFDAVTEDVWHRILDVNVVGPWQLVRAAAPWLRRSGDGCVVNISSLAGSRPVGSSIPYAVSKAALDHLTRLLANQLAPEVRVNAVAPGFIATPWTARGSPERQREVVASAPLGRVGQPEEIAEACVFALGSTYMTGEVIGVNGGRSMR